MEVSISIYNIDFSRLLNVYPALGKWNKLMLMIEQAYNKQLMMEQDYGIDSCLFIIFVWFVL